METLRVGSVLGLTAMHSASQPLLLVESCLQLERWAGLSLSRGWPQL